MGKLVIAKLGLCLQRINGAVGKVSSIAVIVLMACMIVIMGAQVFARYVINSSIFWNEEFARYTLVWCVFLGLGLAYREEQHINISDFLKFFPDKISTSILLFCQAVLIGFLVYLLEYGGILTFNNFKRGHISPAMQMPVYIAYLAMPVGALAMLLQVLQKAVSLSRKLFNL